MDTRTPAEREDSAERDADLMRLRRQGKTFAQIGAELGFSKQYAHRRYTELLKEIPGQEIAEYRREQEERLDGLLREAHSVLARDHIHVSQGRVVRDEHGQPILDDGPKLAAIREIRAIEERRARLLGLDAPTKTEVTGQELKVTVVGVDVNRAMT